MSDIADMMHGIPPQLAAAWGGWLAVGLLLLLWHLRARIGEQEHARLRALARPRIRPGGRPPSGGPTARRGKPAPADPFGEPEALLEPGAGSGPIGRRPGD